MKVANVDFLNESLKSAREKYGRELANFAAQFDPSPSFKYTEWLAKIIQRWVGKGENANYQNANLRNYANTLKIRLQQYDILQKSGYITTPIDTIESWQYLIQVIEEGQEQKMYSSSYQKKLIKTTASKIIEDSDTTKIVIPLNSQAAIVWGRGTKWCISRIHNGEAKFKYYLTGQDTGTPIAMCYFILDKKSKSRYAVLVYKPGVSAKELGELVVWHRYYDKYVIFNADNARITPDELYSKTGFDVQKLQYQPPFELQQYLNNPT